MPNFVTHGLMALDVYNQIEASTVKSAIKKFPEAYLLGSNGPDILFYYQALPWQDQKLNKKVADYGHVVHSSQINEFYNEAVSFIGSIQDGHRQEILISYLAGHLQHWALDSLAHPFVFYRSGSLQGQRPYDHYRYESMIDSLMITFVKRKRLSDLRVKRFVDVNAEQRRIIASFYQRMLYVIFDIQEDTKVIEEAIKTFRITLNYVYDPNNISFHIISAYEKAKHSPWKYSSHVVSSKIESKYDVLNLKHETWSNPTDLTQTSTQSFVDLYNQSIDLGIQSIEKLSEALETKGETFDSLLQGRCYDTGRAEGVEMKFFESVYLKRI